MVQQLQKQSAEERRSVPAFVFVLNRNTTQTALQNALITHTILFKPILHSDWSESESQVCISPYVISVKVLAYFCGEVSKYREVYFRKESLFSLEGIYKGIKSTKCSSLMNKVRIGRSSQSYRCCMWPYNYFKPHVLKNKTCFFSQSIRHTFYPFIVTCSNM